MQERAIEFEARADLKGDVKDALEALEKSKVNVEKNMPWVDINKTKDAKESLQEFRDWWAAREAKQKELPLHEAPAYTKSDVLSKLNKIQKEWKKLESTKKPK